MTGTHLLKRVGAVVVALAVFTTVTAHAKPAGAQLGTVTVEGSLTSGSTLSYEFNLNVLTNTGSLVVKATIVGKKLNLKFPVLPINNPAVGTNNDVSGTSVQIPSTFTGAAVVHVTATFNKKKIGSQILPVTITAPGTNSNPSSLTVTTNLYDVGFENAVTLDGSIVPTSGLAGTLTYVWSQTSGNAVTLSTNGVVATSFITDALTNFVTMTGSPNSMYSSYVAGGVHESAVCPNPSTALALSPVSRWITSRRARPHTASKFSSATARSRGPDCSLWRVPSRRPRTRIFR